MSEQPFAFQRKNYVMLMIGIAVIIIGFILMSGGGSEDPDKFSDAIFSWRRITLAPLVVMFGYGFIMYAILFKGKQENTDIPVQKSTDKESK